MAQEPAMKRACLPVLALVSACGEAEQSAAPAPGAQQGTEAEDNRIACALAGADGFERACTVERASSEDGTVLVLRAPDGGFRRFLITGDGRGVVAADGAEPALVSAVGDNEIEVRVGRDRYRLPATVRPAPHQGQ